MGLSYSDNFTLDVFGVFFFLSFDGFTETQTELSTHQMSRFVYIHFGRLE